MNEDIQTSYSIRQNLDQVWCLPQVADSYIDPLKYKKSVGDCNWTSHLLQTIYVLYANKDSMRSIMAKGVDAYVTNLMVIMDGNTERRVVSSMLKTLKQLKSLKRMQERKIIINEKDKESIDDDKDNNNITTANGNLNNIYNYDDMNSNNDKLDLSNNSKNNKKNTEGQIPSLSIESWNMLDFSQSKFQSVYFNRMRVLSPREIEREIQSQSISADKLPCIRPDDKLALLHGISAAVPPHPRLIQVQAHDESMSRLVRMVDNLLHVPEMQTRKINAIRAGNWFAQHLYYK